MTWLTSRVSRVALRMRLARYHVSPPHGAHIDRSTSMQDNALPIQRARILL